MVVGLNTKYDRRHLLKKSFSPFFKKLSSDGGGGACFCDEIYKKFIFIK